MTIEEFEFVRAVNRLHFDRWLVCIGAIRDSAKRWVTAHAKAEKERCCKAMCEYCRNPDDPAFEEEASWWHEDKAGEECECKAAAIRALDGAGEERDG
jgi:hypothetical protein